MKPYHTGVWGDSGGGKSTLLREMHDRYEGVSIVLNHTSEAGFRGGRAGSPKRARSLIGTADAWEDIRIQWRSQRPLNEQVREIRALCAEIWDEAGVPQQVLVDEAHKILPDYKADSGPGSGNQLRDALHQDRDQGTKVVIASQDPTDLYYPPVKQCRYHVWVGTPGNFHRGFMDYMGLPRDELSMLEDHEYAVLDKQGTILERGRTKETYAT